jgi:drug/metabolite transporter (DMT)-like permease
MTAAFFLLLWPLGGQIPSPEYLWQPAFAGLLFIGGQMLVFLALEKGDVSVATPVMGAKVILVALFTTWIMASPVRPALWAAAGLSCLGIALLHRTAQTSPRHHVMWTTSLALAAATSFAVFDVLVMKWAPRWGVGRFLPLTMLMGAIFSLLYLPLFRQPLRALGAADWRLLLCGGMFMAVQAVLLIATLARFGDATAVNVIFGLRGIWSVAAVWLVGHWFGNRERSIGASGMKWRVVGAALLSGAVVLVFV